MLTDFLYTVQCLVYLLVAFPTERDGDDTDGQYIHFLGSLRDDGGGTCTRTTAHTGSDEYHFSTVVQHVFNVFDTFFRSLAGTCGTIAGTQSFLTQL